MRWNILLTQLMTGCSCCTPNNKIFRSERKIKSRTRCIARMSVCYPKNIYKDASFSSELNVFSSNEPKLGSRWKTSSRYLKNRGGNTENLHAAVVFTF